MARFRLKGKHYLNIPGTEWEHNETNLQTGKAARQRFQVPMYLDPEDPSDCNYPGEIIVTTRTDKAFPRDLLFKGKPTMDMEPLDDEAEKIHTEYLKGVKHPIESLPGTGELFSDALLRTLEKGLAEAQNREVDPRVATMQKQIDDLTALVKKLTDAKQQHA